MSDNNPKIYPIDEDDPSEATDDEIEIIGFEPDSTGGDSNWTENTEGELEPSEGQPVSVERAGIGDHYAWEEDEEDGEPVLNLVFEP